MDRLVSIGRVGAPKGVRGDLKIHSYSGESAHFRKLAVVGLKPGAGATGQPGAKVPSKLSLKVVRVDGEGSSLTMAFEGYGSPEAARVLTGMEIVVPRGSAAPLGPNEWYIDDLVGLNVVDASEAVLAMVDSVLEGGAEPWLEVAVAGAAPGAAARKAIVPFRKEYVGKVDIEAGTLELLAPELLDQ